MNDYIELRLDVSGTSPEGDGAGADALTMETATDVLAAMLAEEGYESFCPDDKGLTAYIRKELYSEQTLADLLAGYPFPSVGIVAKAETVEGRDWNSEWSPRRTVILTASGIADVAGDTDADAPAEYSTIDGIRVDAAGLAPGICLVRRGNTVSKTVVR